MHVNASLGRQLLELIKSRPRSILSGSFSGLKVHRSREFSEHISSNSCSARKEAHLAPLWLSRRFLRSTRTKVTRRRKHLPGPLWGVSRNPDIGLQTDFGLGFMQNSSMLFRWFRSCSGLVSILVDSGHERCCSFARSSFFVDENNLGQQ